MSTQETAVAIRMQDLSPEYAEIMVLGKVLQMSGYFTDVRDQAQAVTKILYGRELGFSPIIAMSGIHIIEGKPSLSANLLAAIIKRSGKYNYRVKEWDDKHCVITFKEKIGDTWEDVGDSGFSIDDAVRAKVKFKSANGHDTTWTKYPKAMLFARALSQGERAYCPDVSACALYVPEELGATVNENGEVLSAQDLPKSARPVAVTTEDIELGSPVVVTAPISKGPESASSNGGERKHEQAAPAAQPLRATVSEFDGPASDAHLPIFYEQVKSEVKAKQEKPKVSLSHVEFEGGLSVKQKQEFAIAFEDACHAKMASAEKKRLRGKWLVEHGFKDDAGQPTSARIWAKDLAAMTREACNWVRPMKPNDAGIVIDDDEVRF